MGEFQDEKGIRHDQILLISVPREQIKRYQRLFGLAGLARAPRDQRVDEDEVLARADRFGLCGVLFRTTLALPREKRARRDHEESHELADLRGGERDAVFLALERLAHVADEGLYARRADVAKRDRPRAFAEDRRVLLADFEECHGATISQIAAAFYSCTYWGIHAEIR